MKLFGEDYSDFYVEEEIGYNACGTEIWKNYRIKFKIWRFGFSFYTYFGHTIDEFHGNYFNIHSSKNKSEILAKYKAYTATTKINKIKENLCS